MSDATPTSPRTDLDAERAVLGAVLFDQGALATVLAKLSPEDFSSPAHRTVLEAMCALDGRRQGIDVVTLSAELRAMSRLNTVGGSQYLDALTDAATSSAFLEDHCALLAELSGVRRMGRAAQKLLRLAKDEAVSPEEVAAAASEVGEAATARVEASGPQSLADGLQEFFTDLEGKAAPGLPTGLRDLDRMTAGPGPGHVWVVAARPGVGKTSLAARMSLLVAQRVGPALFCSLEMPRRELVGRLAAAEARVDLQAIRTRQLGREDTRRLTAAAGALNDVPLWIDDRAGQTLAHIRAHARNMKRKVGLKLITIDYIQLMKSTRRHEKREREVAEVSAGLKELAKELEVAVIVLAQLNRNSEARKDKRPQMSELRESGAIEQDADVVLLAYRESLHNQKAPKDEADLLIAKNRHGPTGAVKLRWNANYAEFSDGPDEHQANDQPAVPGEHETVLWTGYEEVTDDAAE